MEQCDLLLEYLRQQKEKAYELLYHDYYVPLVLFAGKYVGNEEVAKDIVQEFFISLLDKEMVFNNRIALKVYLYTGVRNKSLNYLRHLKIRRQYEMKMLEEGEKQEVFIERMMEEDVFARILTTVKQLPPQCGKVMLLTLKGYKISEVAEFMGISLETAKEYKKDGKKRLYNKLKGGIYSIFIGILFS